MCIEDVRLGRKTGSSLRVVTVDAADKVICQANPKRVSVTFGALGANNFSISDQAMTAVTGGFPVHPGGGPLTLTVQTHGQLVTKELHAFASAAAQPIAVLEAFLQDE